MNRSPQVIVLAGANGAGKSTIAPFLKRRLQVCDFVNADVIAKGLSGFAAESVAVSAGKIMIERLRDFAAEKKTFAFETTLASRTYASWIRDLREQGYRFQLCFLWLPSSGMAIHRVRQRVDTGGHSIERATIIRRYEAGLKNFFRLYRPIADHWRLYDNSECRGPRLIAHGACGLLAKAEDSTLWNCLEQEFGHE